MMGVYNFLEIEMLISILQKGEMGRHAWEREKNINIVGEETNRFLREFVQTDRRERADEDVALPDCKGIN